MSLTISKQTGVAEHPVFLSILEGMSGGALVKVDTRIPTGLNTLYAGTPIATNATAGEYMFMKSSVLATAKVNATTRFIVQRPHPFKVGDFMWHEGMAAASATTITAVGTNYIATVLTSLGAAKGTVITEAAAANATAPKYRPYAMLQNSVRVRNDDGTTSINVFAAAVIRGTCAVSNVTFGVSADVKGRLGDRLRFVNKGQK